LENFADYQSDVGSIRYAFNAAVSASHLADHYFKYYKKYDTSKIKQFKDLPDFLNHLSKKTNGCFKDIRSISNAYKHLYTNTKHAEISSTGAIDSISFKKKVKLQNIEEEINANFHSNDQTSKVIYTRRGGQKIDFLPTLDMVIQFWEKLLNEKLN
jgi:hypothetical protein